ncbi:hypothetical protein QQF64_017741 [Cirrhinus molitorella]|uniref:Uncharacterized protein n=1 Tax=Cirrhinus molitorella TaxID=172907 RepID=A0ABR3LJI4_9TELE
MLHVSSCFFDEPVFSDIVKPAAVKFQRRSALDRGEGDSPVGAGDAEEASWTLARLRHIVLIIETARIQGSTSPSHRGQTD